jgi:hypothetical protein
VSNNIVGPIETPALVIVHQGFHLAICGHAREAPVIAFAHDQTALQIERRTVPADRGPDELWCFPLASTGTACSGEDRQNTNNHRDAMLDLQ